MPIRLNVLHSYLVIIDDIGKRGVGIDSKLLMKAECSTTNYHAVHVDSSAMAMFEEILSIWLGFRMFQLLHSSGNSDVIKNF